MSATFGRSVRGREVEKRWKQNPADEIFHRVMHTIRQDATTITAAREATCARMTLDPGMSGLHHRGVEIIVTTCAFHYGRVQCHARKEPAIFATTTLRAISTAIAATEGRKSDSNEHHVKATAVTSAKPHAISRLRGGNRSLDTA